MENLIKKMVVLTKPNWNSKDIMDWLGVGETQAEEIKLKTLEEYGCITIDIHKKRQCVSADDVIKMCGGKSRLEEMEIYSKLLNYPRIIIGKENYEQVKQD